jgi:Amt family ammonium transporter
MNDQLQLLTTAANILWLLLAGFLVFFMQAGFALVETGFTRAKNVAHTMMMNMMVFGIGAIGYWICGFAFQFGAVNLPYPEVTTAGAIAGPWAFSPLTLGAWGDSLSSGIRLGAQFGIIGTTGFFLQGIGLGAAGIFAFFLFQMVFMDTAATIPTGSGAERIKFIGFVIMGFWVSMIVYPIIGNWVWGGGWLANLGRSLGLGNGAVDFAGSGVVHMTGGAVGLALAMVLGPRIGRFNKDGSANTIPGHNIPMGVLGALILFFGWFGFNPGSAIGLVTPAVVDASGTVTTAASSWPLNLSSIAAVNTLLAGAGGAVSAMTYMWLFGPTKKPSPAMSVNGILAGLVAITAPCAFVNSLGAVIIGLVAGVLVCLSAVWLEKAKIDDPVGAVPVHFVNGIWGVLAVGIFAVGNPDTAAWNGVESAVTGIVGGNFTQIVPQLFEIVAITAVAFGLSYAFFSALKRAGLLRSRAEDEVGGLDLPEMGEQGYVTGGVGVPGGQVEEPIPVATGVRAPAS